KAHRGVDKDLAKTPTLPGRDEFAPGNGLRIGRAGKSAPINRLGTDSHTVVIALELNIFPSPTHPQLTVRAKLLRPVPRHSATDGQNAQALLLQQRVGKVVQIEKRIIAELRLAFPSAHAIVERDVQPQFRIGKGRHKDRNTLLEG